MLVLTRKVGTKVIIGNNITILVNRIRPGEVSLAIDAPKELNIRRAELKPKTGGSER